MSTYRVIDIVPGTSVDGPGLRTAIYFAGCNHRCPECHNPQTWDFSAGADIDEDALMERIETEGFDVSFTGGDPAYRAADLIPLARRIRSAGYSIWLYTGFTFEELLNLPHGRELAELMEVVVDGPFLADLRDIHLRFRGSSNQRLVHVAPTLASGQITLYPADNLPFTES